MEYDIFILPDGTIRFLYYDELKSIISGQTVFKRASHVDPEMTADGPRWFADLHPSSGPKLGPFLTRDDALEAEVKWLVENHLHRSDNMPNML
jgi:hypothetical protein